MFSEEKVRNEVAVMTFLRQNTNIPVPGIIHYGMGDESPAGLGPFILMGHVAHVSNLAAQLRAPGHKRGDRPFLDPDIEEKLAFFYFQVADILLELPTPSRDFPPGSREPRGCVYRQRRPWPRTAAFWADARKLDSGGVLG